MSIMTIKNSEIKPVKGGRVDRHGESGGRTLTLEQINQILISDKCRCGDVKESGLAFCIGCWQELSLQVRKKLYLPKGKRFEGWFMKGWAELDRQNTPCIYKLDVFIE